MSVYDVNGTSINNCYNENGTGIHLVYDANGSQIPIVSELVNVMTFNVQWWSGLNGNQALISGIFDDTTPIIVGLQECRGTGTGGYVPNTFAYGQVATGATNPSGIMSQIPFEDFTSHTYSKSVETRGYSKCYITINGKRIAWFNTHVEYYDTLNDSRYPIHVLEMKEIFEATQTEDTFILTGDFNVLCKSKSDQAYTDTIKQFADAGYNMSNWTDETGFVDTWFNGSTVEGSSQKYPCDNIITSSDIQIVDIEYNTAKLTAGGTIDHIPIISTIRIPTN